MRSVLAPGATQVWESGVGFVVDISFEWAECWVGLGKRHSGLAALCQVQMDWAEPFHLCPYICPALGCPGACPSLTTAYSSFLPVKGPKMVVDAP